MLHPPASAAPDFALRLALEARAGGPLPDWRRIQEASVTIVAEPGQVIFGQGVFHPFLYLVQSGVVELAARDARGRRVVSDFGTEGQIMADLRGLGSSLVNEALDFGLEPVLGRMADGPRTVRSMRAVDHAVLVGIDARVLDDLSRRHAAWGVAALSMVLNYSLRLELREFERRSLGVEERYRLLLAERPTLVSRLRQKDLARLLDVSEAALSRIAARLRAVPASPGSA